MIGFAIMPGTAVEADVLDVPLIVAMAPQVIGEALEIGRLPRIVRDQP
ncbi:hypothetical protein [Microbacterium sp.]|nr:hypothetical protein [Microbacterium sp.]